MLRFFRVVIIYLLMLWSKKSYKVRSLKVLNHEILGAQHHSLYGKSKFFQSPKGKS